MTSASVPFVKSDGLLRFVMGVGMVCLSLVSMPALSGADAARSIQLEFFWAKDCPHCEAVRDLVQMIQMNYKIKVKDVDVETQKGYEEFVRVGKRFRKDPPAVPLIVLGGQVLMGEAEIKANLEQKIDSLIHHGRASARAATRQKTGASSGPQQAAQKKTAPPSGHAEAQTGKMKVTSDE
ncbi:MAG: glutaredoxin family protein [Desulfomonilaceae bacterium]